MCQDLKEPASCQSVPDKSTSQPANLSRCASSCLDLDEFRKRMKCLPAMSLNGLSVPTWTRMVRSGYLPRANPASKMTFGLDCGVVFLS